MKEVNPKKLEEVAGGSNHSPMLAACEKYERRKGEEIHLNKNCGSCAHFHRAGGESTGRCDLDR